MLHRSDSCDHARFGVEPGDQSVSILDSIKCAARPSGSLSGRCGSRILAHSIDHRPDAVYCCDQRARRAELPVLGDHDAGASA